MPNKSGKPFRVIEGKGSQTKASVEPDVDALFQLPLTEFIAARKKLAVQLKKDGRVVEADQVKSLSKPSVSAWAVNQLYWNHREIFDQLLATGQKVRQAQTSRFAGKSADMRGPLDTRREVLAELGVLAATLLRDAGHNPSPDTLLRITTTLEAMSAYASLPETSTPGRLTHDVDPPGFESLASLVPGAGIAERTELPRNIRPAKASTSNTTARKVSPVEVARIEKTRQERLAAAKLSVQDAKRALSKAMARVKSAELVRKKLLADAKEKEKQRREAELRFEKARVASEAASQRAVSAEVEAEEATEAVADAEQRVEQASKELESLFRDSS